MNVVVTSGGTIAPIDDVRQIANTSTGRFGATIAEAALLRGAHVWYIHAPNALRPFDRQAHLDLNSDFTSEVARLQQVRSNWLRFSDQYHPVPLRTGTVFEYAEQLEAVLKARPIDLAFLAMAASDYAPQATSGKLSSDSAELTLRCHRLPKVIRSVKDWSPETFLVGFKLLSNASTAELIGQATTATLETRADLTVANDLTTVKHGRHVVHLVRAGQNPETLGPGDSVADDLVERAMAWASAQETGQGPG